MTPELHQWADDGGPAFDYVQPLLRVEASDDSILASLDLICPHNPVELRVLTNKMQVQRFADHVVAARHAARCDATAKAIYIVMNPFDPSLIKGTAVDDNAITRRRRLLIDVDPVRVADTNATADELAHAYTVAERVKGYLTDRGWPDPIEAGSGNGRHLIYAIDLPNDAASLALVANILKYLATTFDTKAAHVDTSVSNASRITKLYGTMVRKGPATPERPHSRSAISRVPTPLVQVSLDALQRIAALVPAPAAMPTPAKIVPPVFKAGTQYRTLFQEGSRLRYRGYGEAEVGDALWSLHKNRSEDAVRPGAMRADIDKIAAAICKKYPQGLKDFQRYTKPKSREGDIIADNQDNIRLGLQRLGLELRYDQFADHALVAWQGDTQVLEDPVFHRAWLEIDTVCKFKPSLPYFEIVVNDLARRDSFHPVLDYFDTLHWDGVPRLDLWLVTYAGATDSAYTRAVGGLMLKGAVRRVRAPGTKFDTIPVFESEQGMDKSKAMRALCPNESWFSDDLPLTVDSKQIIERTSGKWIVEASDLQGYTDAKVEKLKAMLSRQVDGPVRLAYGRQSTERRRQFVIVGTTNKFTEYLRDTANRRYWPIRITHFDIEKLKRDRDQLWAEAAVRESAGDEITLPEDLWAVAALETEARREVDPFEDLLEDHLAGGFNQDAILVRDIWRALGDAAAHYKRDDATRIATVMQARKFTRKKKIDVEVVTTVFDGKGHEEQVIETKKLYAWIRDGVDVDTLPARRVEALTAPNM